MKTYTVNLGGLDHTVQLDEDDAKRLGLSEKDEAKAKAKTAQNKSATPGNTK